MGGAFDGVVVSRTVTPVVNQLDVDSLEIGIVTPTRGRFMAPHMRKGEASPFDSMQDAMQALWEMD